MYTIFKIVCIIVLMIGAGVNYLMVAFADNEHDNFHGIVKQMTKPIILVDNSILAMRRGLTFAVKNLSDMLMGGIRYEQ